MVQRGGLPQVLNDDERRNTGYRAHVIDHRAALLHTPRQGEHGGGGGGGAHDPMPSPRSAVARNQLRGSYQPPQRGTRAVYIPSARKQRPAAAAAAAPAVAVERVQPALQPLQPPPGIAPLQPPPGFAPLQSLQPQPASSTAAQRPAVNPAGAKPPAGAAGEPSRPPPWWWPKDLEATDASEGLPHSLASMLASEMVKVAAASTDVAAGPTPALKPAERKQALQVAESPFQLVSAALRTRAAPEPAAPEWATFDVPLVGAEWRGDPVAPSVIRTQELQRSGNEQIFNSATAVVKETVAVEGPMVQLTPHGCVFTGEPVRMSFAITRMLEGHTGDAFIAVMRKRSGGAPWTPLEEDESLTITPNGMAVVELRQFCWVKAWCFRSKNQDNDVAGLVRTVFAATLDKNDDGVITAEEEAEAGWGREKREGDEAKLMGYIGITGGSTGYLIPGIAALGIKVVDGVMKVLNNPTLAQRTAKEFSADSPIKLLSNCFKGFCYPAPPSNGGEAEKIQIGFRAETVPFGNIYTEDDPELEREKDLSSVPEEPEPEPEQAEEGGGEATAAQPGVALGQELADDEAGRLTKFLAAARAGDVAEIQRLLALDVGVNSTDDEGNSALMAASGDNRAAAVSELLGAGAVADLANMHGETAIMLASEHGSDSVAELLIGAKAKLDMVDHDGRNAVLNASRAGHAVVLALLVDSGASLTVDFGETPLHVASENNHVDCVHLLLEGGADVDKVDSFGNTALMNAAVSGHAAVVEELLDGRANPDLEGSGGQTALAKAAKADQEESVSALITGKVSLDNGDDAGNTALMLAASKGNLEVVNMLVEAKASVVRRNKSGLDATAVAKEAGQDDAYAILAAIDPEEEPDEAAPAQGQEEEAAADPEAEAPVDVAAAAAVEAAAATDESESEEDP